MESSRVMCPHCDGWFFPEEGVSLDDCPVCGRTVEVKPAPAPCSGCGCEHDEIHNPTDTCATCNGGSRYHMPKPAPAPLNEEVDDAIKELCTLAAIEPGDGLAAVTCDIIRAHISDLTRRLADAEAAYKHVKQCLHIFQGRAKRAEERIQELEDMRND